MIKFAHFGRNLLLRGILLSPSMFNQRVSHIPLSAFTVRGQLFDTIALNDDCGIKSSSNLKSNDIFGKLIQFCVQNCPWMLNLMKN